MQDLNELYYFAQVVEHGGFAAAGRALALPKSTLSRRVAQLEERLGVRLIQRSSHAFAVTELGQLYLRHCRAMLAEAEAAEEVIERARSEPQGIVRVACPMVLAQIEVGPLAAAFLRRHPRVTLRMEVTNRRVDLVEEGFDLALRVRQPPLEPEDLVVRVLSRHETLLVASPELLARRGRPRTPDDLQGCDSVAMTGRAPSWRLHGPDNALVTLRHVPRLEADDLATLRHAAVAGLGFALLPRRYMRQELADGRLEVVLPAWRPADGLLHLVFPSRRGLIPAVRSFIDFLVAGLAGDDG